MIKKTIKCVIRTIIARIEQNTTNAFSRRVQPPRSSHGVYFLSFIKYMKEVITKC